MNDIGDIIPYDSQYEGCRKVWSVNEPMIGQYCLYKSSDGRLCRMRIVALSEDLAIVEGMRGKRKARFMNRCNA